MTRTKDRYSCANVIVLTPARTVMEATDSSHSVRTVLEATDSSHFVRTVRDLSFERTVTSRARDTSRELLP